LIFGHAASFHLFEAGEITEFAIIRTFFEQGVFHFLILMTFLCYPYFIVIKKSKYIQPLLIPFLGAFSVGLLSLWHYGSLFRITNEIIFLIFFVQIIALLKNND